MVFHTTITIETAITLKTNSKTAIPTTETTTTETANTKKTNSKTAIITIDTIMETVKTMTTMMISIRETVIRTSSTVHMEGTLMN